MSEQPQEERPTARRHDAEHVQVLSEQELDATIAQLEKTQGLKWKDDGDAPEPKNTSEETPPASSEATALEKAEAPSTPDKEYDEAKAALKRTQGLSQTALDNLSREDAIALAAPLKENRAQLDEIHRQLAELRKEKEAGQIGTEDSEDLGAPDAKEHPSKDASTLQSALAALADEFGEEGAEAVAALINPLVSQIETLKGMLGDVVAENRQTAAGSVFTELAEGGYPQLKRAEAREAVQSHAAQLVQEGKAPDVRTAVLQATKTFYGEGQAPSDPNQSAREQGVLRNGEYSGGHKERELTPEEAADAILYAAMDRAGA